MTTSILARIALSVLLVYLAACDWRHGRVPNAVVLPLLALSLVVFGWRAAAGEFGWGETVIVAVSWVVGLALWSLRVFGAGDVKLALALIGLFPDLRFILLLLGILLVGMLALLAWQEGRPGLRRVQALFITAAGGSFPMPGEIRAAYQARPNRITLLIGIAGLIYMLPV